MAFPWAAAGTFLGGAASAFQALTGGEGGHKALSRKQGYQNLELQRRSYFQGVQDRVADARKAGLHPLFALGYQGNVSFPSSDYSGSPRYEIGQGLANMGRGMEGMTRGRKEKAVQMRGAEATTRRLEAEAVIASVEAANAVEAANSTRPEPQSQVMETQEGVPHLYRRWYDNLTGEYVWLPNTEAGVEMPETVGAGYWAKAKYHDPDVKKLRRIQEHKRMYRMERARQRARVNPPEVMF